MSPVGHVLNLTVPCVTAFSALGVSFSPCAGNPRRREFRSRYPRCNPRIGRGDFPTRRALIAPCTTLIRDLLSEVVVEPTEDPIPRRSAVNLDSVEIVSVAVLVDRIGRLAGSRVREICAALAVAVDCSD